MRLPPAVSSALSLRATFSTAEFGAAEQEDSGTDVSPEDRPYLHHGRRPRHRGYEKFQSPRKRANKLMNQLLEEGVTQLKASKPAVWETDFRVGDAVELQVVSQGGVKSENSDKYRGVVLGIFKKRLDTSILIRDVVFGEPIERRIPLHSPLVKSLKVLERNFVFKGKKKIKRAKLYYLSERNPLLTQVTGSKWKS
jgi:large subunit ribosomal protein L19